MMARGGRDVRAKRANPIFTACSKSQPLSDICPEEYWQNLNKALFHIYINRKIAGESGDYCPCGLLDSFGQDILNYPCQ